MAEPNLKEKCAKIVYEQEMHCCGDSDELATLTLELHDGGGGDYLVVHAKHWALDSDADVDSLAAKIKAMLPCATPGE